MTFLPETPILDQFQDQPQTLFSMECNSKNTMTHNMIFLPRIFGYVLSMAQKFHGLNHYRKKFIVKMVRRPVNNIPQKAPSKEFILPFISAFFSSLSSTFQLIYPWLPQSPIYLQYPQVFHTKNAQEALHQYSKIYSHKKLSIDPQKG